MTLGALACGEACLWAFSLHKCCSIFLHMPADMHHTTPFCLVSCNTMRTQYSEMSCLSLPCLPTSSSLHGKRICFGILCFGILAMCPNHRIQFNITISPTISLIPNISLIFSWKARHWLLSWSRCCLQWLSHLKGPNTVAMEK